MSGLKVSFVNKEQNEFTKSNGEFLVSHEDPQRLSMGRLKLVSLAKGSELLAHAPVANFMMDYMGKEPDRIEMREQPDGIFVRFRSVGAKWDQETITETASLLKTAFIKAAYQPVMDQELLDASPAYQELQTGENKIKKLIKEKLDGRVKETVDRDGGGLFPVSLDLNGKTGEITCRAILFGSCSSCAMAELKTLMGATKLINAALDNYKQENPNDAVIQNLSFKGFIKETANDFLMYKSPQASLTM